MKKRVEFGSELANAILQQDRKEEKIRKLRESPEYDELMKRKETLLEEIDLAEQELGYLENELNRVNTKLDKLSKGEQ